MFDCPLLSSFCSTRELGVNACMSIRFLLGMCNFRCRGRLTGRLAAMATCKSYSRDLPDFVH